MSVNSRGQDTGFASFIRAPPNLRRYGPTPQLYLDIPQPAPIQQPVQYPQPLRPAYRLPLQPVAHNTLPRARQHYQFPRMADQDFKMDFMFDECFDNTDGTTSASKPVSALQMYPQAMPTSYSFRPLYPADPEPCANLSNDTFPAQKIETTLDVPTPAIVSTSVDVFQYESLRKEDWMDGLPEYTGISPASQDMYDSSPCTDHGHAFNNNNFSGSGFGSWTQAHPHSMRFGSLHSIAPSTTDGSSASPALSYDGFNDQARAASWGTSMFGQPDVVLPSHLYRTQPRLEPVPDTIHEIHRPVSQQSDHVSAVVPTMSREDSVEDEAYVKRRDQMLIDLRDKGHSYKEIKRMGRFKEAESTLRGRLRTLTKEKAERVRKPKWTDRDIELLNEAVDYFLAEPSKSARKRKPFRKLPWKKISLWMKDNGSSYQFAPATCAKKWEEI